MVTYGLRPAASGSGEAAGAGAGAVALRSAVSIFIARAPTYRC